MRWFAWFTRGIANAFRRRQLERDVRDEMAFHLSARAEDLRRRGLAAEEAERIAKSEFGSLASVVERTREHWGFRLLTDVRQDMRHALRMFARSPMFTSIAMLSVAIGIGANASIFSIADALLFRPLGIRDPAGLMAMDVSSQEQVRGIGTVSYPNYLDVRERAASFDGVIAYQLSTFSFAAARETVPEMRMGMQVSDNFFQVLGVSAALGRTFARGEGVVPDRDAILVLGHDFWEGPLGGDPSIVGRTLWLNGVAVKVIGVAPERFTGMDQYLRPAFFVPATMARRLTRSEENQITSRSTRVFEMRGRLKPGVTRGSAQEEAAVVWAALVQEFPDVNRNLAITLRTDLESRMRQSPEDAQMMLMLLALVSVVLAIACANVANLLLGRARARSKEMAIRLALGVSRFRLCRQLLTESALLAAGGAAIGLVLAKTQMRPISIPTDLPVVIEPQLDTRLLAFTLAVTVLSVLLFGVVPALQSLRTSLVPALKRSEAGRPVRQRTPGRSTLVVAQIALSMSLLVGAGVLFDGFRKALALDPGFRTDHVLAMTVDASLVGRSDSDAQIFFRALVDRAAAVPGVESAALTGAVPLDNNGEGENVVPEGYQFPAGTESAPVFSGTVTERYFDTIGTDIVRGRAFRAVDREDTEPVVVVNEQFAQTYWPGQDPLGKRLKLADADSPWRTVVGITETGTYLFLAEPPRPFVYLPLMQHPRSRLSLVVHSAMADPSELVTPLREIVHDLDPNQPVYNVRSMTTFYEQRALSAMRGLVETVGTMAGVGAALALIGLYGLVAYSVACRTREIGIRIAIGASRSDVLRMVLRQGLLLSIAGIVVGALGSVAVVRMLRSGLSGLGEAHWSWLATAPALLIALTLAASYVPARRASLVDPLRAVRDE